MVLIFDRVYSARLDQSITMMAIGQSVVCFPIDGEAEYEWWRFLIKLEGNKDVYWAGCTSRWMPLDDS